MLRRIITNKSVDCKINNVPRNYVLDSNYDTESIGQRRTDGHDGDIRYLYTYV